MDDIIVRPRNPRYNIPNKLPPSRPPHGKSPYRRRVPSKEETRLAEIVIKQLIVAGAIFLLIIFVKSINTPVTNFLSDKARLLVSSNINFDEIYKSIDATVSKISDDVTGQGKKEDDTPTDKSDAQGLQTADTDPQSAVQKPEGTYVDPDAKIIDYSNYNEKDSADAGGSKGGTTDSTKKGTTSDSTSKDTDNTAYKKAVEFIKSKYTLLIPVNGAVTSPFGERVDPIKNVEASHRGVDIAANKGVSIKAALDGTVIVAGVDDVYGNYIKIDHSNGVVTLYAHCSKLLVKKGQKVKKGAVIAYVGDTGNAIGPHLHFEVVKDDRPLNPLEFIKLPMKE